LLSKYVSPKHWYLSTSPHNITAQKTNTDVAEKASLSNPKINHEHSQKHLGLARGNMFLFVYFREVYHTV
jgi:hypothetical protein